MARCLDTRLRPRTSLRRLDRQGLLSGGGDDPKADSHGAFTHPGSLARRVGHLPLLFDENYGRYLRELSAALASAGSDAADDAFHEAQVRVAELRSENVDSDVADLVRAEARLREARDVVSAAPSLHARLSRLFLWTIEFGLIGTLADYRLLGAGILSSRRECLAAIERKARVLDYSIDALEHDFNFVDAQKLLFVAPDLKSYQQVLARALGAD